MEIIFWLGFCALVGYYADKKGRSGIGWAVLSFFISPLFAGIALAMSSDLSLNQKIEVLDGKTDNIKREMEFNERIQQERLSNIHNQLSSAQQTYGHLASSQHTAAGDAGVQAPKMLEAEGVENQIRKYQKMLDDGLITIDEYKDIKQKIINKL
jgi:hypothetical protein